MDDPAREKNSFITEGILIAVIPAISYLLAFVFEAGYLNIFKIPISFIRIDLTTVFITGSSLVFVSFLLLILTDLFSMVFSVSEDPISKHLARLFPLLLVSVALTVFVLGTSLQPMLIGLGIVWIVQLFFLFIFPLITQRNKESYREKLDAQQAHDAQMDSVLKSVSQRLGGVAYVIIFLFMVLIVTYYAGQSSALKQREYLVASTSPELVVLRIYGDTMICAQFDRNKRVVSHDFRFLKVAEDSDIIFTLENIGPLDQITPTPVRPTHTPTIKVPKTTLTP